ncbi:MAG: methylmalonyl-CoA mutase family protein [Bacillota bacterium]
MEKDMQKTNEIPAVSFDEFKKPSYDEWKEAAIALLKGAPFDKKLKTKLYEGITLEPIYNAPDIEKLDKAFEFPGFSDYLRGTDPAGYMAEPWTISQGVDAVLAKDANEIIKHELEKGATGVNIVLDEASRKCTGFDKDAEGRGVSIITVDDMKAVLADVDLQKYKLNIYAGASALPMLGLVMAADNKDVKGCIGADPIAALAEDGKLPCSLEQLYDEMACAAKVAADKMPGLKTILINGSVYHNGGANAIQEVAYSVATAIAYIDAMVERGLDINTVAKQIRFTFSIGANFFMEIAKFRAVKMVWAQVVKAYGGDAEAQKIDIYARTSKFTATVNDPYVNVLRATTQAFSAVVGGIDEMEVAPFDDAIGASCEQSRRIARNQQIMMQNEFNLLQPVDPAGGSWYVEYLTNKVANMIWEKVQAVDAEGGMVELLKKGAVQDAIAEIMNQRFKNLATRKDRAVGTNMYANKVETPFETPCQCDAKAARAKECENAVDNAPKVDVAGMIAEGNTVLCGVIHALQNGGCAVCVREALNKGEALEVAPVQAHRWTEQYEALRERTINAAKEGKTINVFSANYGKIPNHKPRADFSRGFFEVGFFDVIGNDGFPTAEEVAKAAIDSKAEVVCICGKDVDYPEIVPVIAKAVKAANPETMVILAGAPAAEYKDAYDAAGVDEYIHVKANCLDILTKIQKARGIC